MQVDFSATLTPSEVRRVRSGQEFLPLKFLEPYLCEIPKNRSSSHVYTQIATHEKCSLKLRLTTSRRVRRHASARCCTHVLFRAICELVLRSLWHSASMHESVGLRSSLCYDRQLPDMVQCATHPSVPWNDQTKFLYVEPKTPRCCLEPCGRRGPGLTRSLAASRIFLLVDGVLLQPMLQGRAGPVRHHAFATVTTVPPWSRKLLTDAKSINPLSTVTVTGADL